MSDTQKCPHSPPSGPARCRKKKQCQGGKSDTRHILFPPCSFAACKSASSDKPWSSNAAGAVGAAVGAAAAWAGACRLRRMPRGGGQACGLSVAGGCLYVRTLTRCNEGTCEHTRTRANLIRQDRRGHLIAGVPRSAGFELHHAVKRMKTYERAGASTGSPESRYVAKKNKSIVKLAELDVVKWAQVHTADAIQVALHCVGEQFVQDGPLLVRRRRSAPCSTKG